MRRFFSLSVIVTLSVIAVSLGMASWALHERFDQTNERRLQQASFNSSLRRQAVENCREIESLKAKQRAEAEKSFRDLSRNLALLHLTRTPELMEVARQTRDQKLARFKTEPCPRSAQKAP